MILARPGISRILLILAVFMTLVRSEGVTYYMIGVVSRSSSIYLDALMFVY
jgi:hypothetical protein